MEAFATALQTFVAAMKSNAVFMFGIVIALWVIHLINFLMGYRLNALGIKPRTVHGFIGILFAPFLHGDFGHLFFNSIPLFVLIGLVLLSGYTVFYSVSLTIILLSGFAVWLVARPAIHVGASSVIMGYFGYLLTNAYYHPSAMTFILAAVCLYYFGGLVIMLIPGEKSVSWEGHIFGFIAGVAAAFLCANAAYINHISRFLHFVGIPT